jgi:hypothetical protein
MGHVQGAVVTLLASGKKAHNWTNLVPAVEQAALLVLRTAKVLPAAVSGFFETPAALLALYAHASAFSANGEEPSTPAALAGVLVACIAHTASASLTLPPLLASLAAVAQALARDATVLSDATIEWTQQLFQALAAVPVQWAGQVGKRLNASLPAFKTLAVAICEPLGLLWKFRVVWCVLFHPLSHSQSCS